MAYSPRDTVIARGQSFVASASMFTCGGTVPVTSVNIWATSDTAVLVVDSVSGKVTGKNVGQASVLLLRSSLPVTIPVTVR